MAFSSPATQGVPAGVGHRRQLVGALASEPSSVHGAIAARTVYARAGPTGHPHDRRPAPETAPALSTLPRRYRLQHRPVPAPVVRVPRLWPGLQAGQTAD